MPKQAQLTITREDGEKETIQCYIQLSGIFRRKNRMTWVGKKSIDKKQKEFTSSAGSHEEAWRDINTQCHDFKMKGKRSILKRNEFTCLTTIVNTMLAAPFEVLECEESARYGYAYDLKRFTGHLPGAEPEWEWTDASKTVRQFKEGSKWDKLSYNDFTKAFCLDQRTDWLKDYPNKKSTAYHSRARGWFSMLKAVRAIVQDDWIDVLYKPKRIKLPNLSELRRVKKMSTVPEVKYTAPDIELMDKVIASMSKLKEICLDTWLTFVMAADIGLRWSEIRNARFSWFKKERVHVNGEVVDRYVCHVQATKDWTPKKMSEGKVVISKDTYDSIMATRGVSRERFQISPSRLQELVWSKPAMEVAKELGYSDVGLGKVCSRLGVAKPPRGFWGKVKAGTIPHPQGQPIEGYAKVSNVITLADSENASDRVLVRYNSKATCASSANRKLKDWMKKHGWTRNHGAHELRAYNGSVTATQTGSLIAAQNQMRHKQYSTTAKHYVDLVEPLTHTVNFSKSA